MTAMTKLKSGKVEKLKSPQPFNSSTFRLEKAVRAQGGAVAKPHQVKAMVLAARRAYKVQSDAGLVDDGVDFDSWRRATLHDVVGAAAPSSFRAVTQRDFAAVVEYFRELAGDGNVANVKISCSNANNQLGTGNTRTLATLDEQRRALWALRRVEEETAEAFGGREGARRYADALFEKIHRTSRLVADAKQTWAVIFTMRNRAKKKVKSGGVNSPTPPLTHSPTRSKTALGARGAAGVHLSPPDGSECFPAFSRAL